MTKGWVRILAMTAVAFAATFLLHWAMEWVVHTYDLGNEITEGLLAASIAAVLVCYIGLVAHWRRVQYRQRLEAIATLNHHVRNALQTMVAFTDGQLPASPKDLNHAIHRIDWVLRNVEPHLTQQETRFQ